MKQKYNNRVCPIISWLIIVKHGILKNFKFTSTREAIVLILSEEWPLTAKQITFRVVKNRSKHFSYQAIHKQIMILMRDNVLTQINGKYYAINKKWLDRLIIFGQNTKEKYNSFPFKINPDTEILPFLEKNLVIET